MGNERNVFSKWAEDQKRILENNSNLENALMEEDRSSSKSLMISKNDRHQIHCLSRIMIVVIKERRRPLRGNFSASKT